MSNYQILWRSVSKFVIREGVILQNGMVQIESSRSDATHEVTVNATNDKGEILPQILTTRFNYKPVPNLITEMWIEILDYSSPYLYKVYMSDVSSII